MNLPFKHVMPVRAMEEDAKESSKFQSDQQKNLAQMYYDYLLEKFQYALSLKRDYNYSADDIEYMQNMLKMYVGLKYIDTESSARVSGSTILDSWRTFKPELVGVLLEDMINHPNEAVERFLLKPRDKMIEDEKHIYIPLTTEDSSTGKTYSHKLLHIASLDEREILEKQVYFSTMQRYGLNELQARLLYKKALRMYSKNRFPMNILLDLVENTENVFHITESDEVLTEECILSNIVNGIDEGRKTLIMQNPKVLLARLNFLRAIYYEQVSGESLGKAISDPFRLANTLMWSREGFYESYSQLIDKLMQNSMYSPKQKAKKGISYAEIQDAYLDSDEFNFTTDENGEKIERTDDEKKQLRLHFIDAVLNKEFGELSHQDTELLDKYYEVANANKSISVDDSKAEKQDIDLIPIVHETTSKKGRRKVYIRMTEEGGEREGGDKIPSDKPRKPRKPKRSLDDIIDDYVDKVEELGIECEVEVESERYTNGQRVRYLIFRAGNYRICETVGQEGNRTYILKSDASIEDFEEELARRDTNFLGLSKTGEAVGINHIGGTKEASLFNPNRILILSELIASCDIETSDIHELRCKLEEIYSEREDLSLEELRKFIVHDVDISETPVASEYIMETLELQEEHEKRQEALRKFIEEQMRKEIEKHSEELGLSERQLGKRNKDKIVNLKNLEIQSNKREKRK